jgi:hypothetical protein
MAEHLSDEDALWTALYALSLDSGRIIADTHHVVDVDVLRSGLGSRDGRVHALRFARSKLAAHVEFLGALRCVPALGELPKSLRRFFSLVRARRVRDLFE